MKIEETIYLTIFSILNMKNIKKLKFKKDINDIIYGSIIGYYFGGLFSGVGHWFSDSYDIKSLRKLVNSNSKIGKKM